MADSRIERDCLGEMEIPNDRYYGIQTTRMLGVSGAAGVAHRFLSGYLPRDGADQASRGPRER